MTATHDVSRAQIPRVFVPLDDRPCTRDFACQLAPLAGWTLERPPDALLGTFTSPGDTSGLAKWLREALPRGSGGNAILSVDMLVFGGLVASRASEVDEHEALSRLAELGRMLEASAAAVDVFSILMRVPPFCVSDRDRRLADRLLAYSKAAARAGTSPGPLTRMRLKTLERALPREFMERYRHTRLRNHAVNRRVLEWAQKGTVAFTLIGMDDSRTEGFNVAERRTLEPLLRVGRSDVLPGADEVALLLLARRALIVSRRRPRVAVHYSPGGLWHRTTRYEDRTVEALLRAHARTLGVEIGEPGSKTDFDLFVHGPGRAQQEAAAQLLPPRPSARHLAFARAIADALDEGRLVAVADLGYANGGDRGLFAALCERVDLPMLGAFAAWNTAGNTVGTALAHVVLRWLALRHPHPEIDAHAAERAHQHFLLQRFLDDTIYQSGIRNEIGLRLALERVNVYALGEHHAAVEARVAERMQQAASDFFDRCFRDRHIRNEGGAWRIEGPLHLSSYLPWPRIFEVGLDTRFALRPA